MSDLNVTTISNSNIAKTDKLLAFNNSDSKAATIQDVVQLVPGKMAVATCNTAGNVATKAVTCDDWTNKPGLSILVEFSNANSADNVTLSINNGTAIPVYYMNTATEQVSGGAIPAGAVVFTLNAAGNKFYAHVTNYVTYINFNGTTDSNGLLDLVTIGNYIPIIPKDFPYITNFFNGSSVGYHPYVRITNYDGTPYANQNVSMRLCVVPFSNG